MYTLHKGIFHRILISGCVALWCSAPGLAAAAGFGKPVVFSAIGDPLKVTVPLVSIQQGELDDLEIGLAGPSWYQLSGLDYSALAERLLVRLDTQNAIAPEIIVSTSQGVNQVAVPLVLELSWPHRVMRKQFTVLLNPRGYVAGNSPQQNTAAFARGAAEPADVSEDSTESVNETAGLSGNTRTEGVNSVTGSQDASSSPASSARANSVLVKRGDSLSAIVERFLPDGASRFQGRMGFYNENQHAFQDGNIHLLTSGVSMTVPAVDTILAIPAAQARSQYQQLAAVVPQAAENQDIAQRTDNNSSQENSSQQNSSQGGFRFSLLELDDADTSEIEAPVATDAVSRTAVSAGAPEALADQAGLDAPGNSQQFEMQGFTMKLTVLNAYIVELQDENQLLKARVAALEQKVEALIRGNAGIEADQVGFDTLAVERAIEADQQSSALQDVFQPLETDSEPVDIAQADAAAEGQRMAGSTGSESPGLDQVISGGSDLSAETEALDDLSYAEPVVSEQHKVLDTAATPDSTVSETMVASQNNSVAATAETIDSVDSVVELSTSDSTEASPGVVFRRNLINQAGGYVNQLNTPLTQLLLTVLLAGLLLLGWLLRKGRRKSNSDYGELDQGFALDPGEQIGVSYDSDNAMMLDLDEDDNVASSQEITADNLSSMQEGDVDLITQSEVYMTYNRPTQAIQALLEEYLKPDCDKFVVASRLIKVYEQMGENEERNDSLRAFIVTLNKDIDQFSSVEWDKLRSDLDVLRRSEHHSAVSQDATAGSSRKVDSLIEITLPEGEIDFSPVVENADKNITENNVIELDYHPSDKVGSN